MAWERAVTNRLGNRPVNQDRCGVATTGRLALAVIADGMGGHPRGELAAEVAVRHLLERFRADPDAAVAAPKAFLREAVAEAHEAVVAAGRAESPPVDPRTTIVACLAVPGRAWWIHAGDSRLYHLRGDRVLVRTRDHTYVAALEAQALLTPDEAMRHPLRNYILESLGGEEAPHPDTDEAPLAPGDVLLLCTDGLWAVVPERMLSALGRAPELGPALEALAAEAEASAFPYSDNVSAVALRWQPDTTDRPGDEADFTAEQGPPAAGEGTADPLEQAIRTLREALAEHERGGHG